MCVKTSADLKFRLLWLCIGYSLVALVAFLSLTNEPIDVGEQFLYIDKFYHFIAYFSLTAWFIQIYRGRFQRYLLFIVFIVMGCLFEYLQSFNVNRLVEISDMVANILGVVIGYLLSYSIKIKRLS